jgi:hypothetical protein
VWEALTVAGRFVPLRARRRRRLLFLAELIFTIAMVGGCSVAVAYVLGWPS